MLADQIHQDYMQAMKAKDRQKVSTLSFLRAQIKNVMIEKKADKAEDDDIIAVIKKQVKQRQDSIRQYEEAGRCDLAEKETQELGILKAYLPEELSDAQIREAVQNAVQECRASGPKDMGAVMKAVLPMLGGRADNKKVSALVKEILSSFNA